VLFLGAGSVIIALHHEQDMRRMGGLRKYMPITYATMLIGAFANAGFPPFAGFFSQGHHHRSGARLAHLGLGLRLSRHVVRRVHRRGLLVPADLLRLSRQGALQEPAGHGHDAAMATTTRTATRTAA